ncbi:unnamed protein product [Adineta steineri]|uniref:Uncharacterized protein n=1 Tax=Adineta steineri TaxID=433720 RepID=A0A816B4Q6_9BILA|nr:unnamed protein product [Adineta steineri]CAF1605893.1 unnamed protein product [Adineta steineri]
MFIHKTPAAYYGRSIKITSDILEDNNQFIIYRQSTALLSHGFSSWPAAISLGDYLMKRIHLLGNKCIIELGAGSGLLGLTLLKYSAKILSYTFTDYSPMILNLL